MTDFVLMLLTQFWLVPGAGAFSPAPEVAHAEMMYLLDGKPSLTGFTAILAGLGPTSSCGRSLLFSAFNFLSSWEEVRHCSLGVPMCGL